MKYRFYAFLATLLLLGIYCHGREAKVIMVKRQAAKEIVTEKDHLNVTFTTGWVSKKDSLLIKIFSSATKVTADASAAGTYFDGDQLKNAWVVENTDVSHDLDRPWGIANKDLLTGIPADTAVTTFTLKMAAYKDDRFKQIIDAFKGAQPTSPPAGFSLTVEPYLTYASIADALFGSLFGTNKTTYPFLIETGIYDNTVKTQNGMLEHYLVAIAPNKDGDDWLKNLDASQLTYDEVSVVLKYNGSPVQDHTYAVVWVGLGADVDITKMLLNSKAAWAVLALTDFYSSPLPDINKKEDVPGFDKSMVQQLAACIDQLKRELRFSAYDRAVALRAFADRAEQEIRAACDAKGIAASDCKTPQIENFKNGIPAKYQIKNLDILNRIPGGAKELNLQINEHVSLKLPE